MGIHGLSSCEKGPRSPDRKALERDKATDDGIAAPVKKKTAKKTAEKKVDADVANDQTGSSEVDSGDKSQPNG